MSSHFLCTAKLRKELGVRDKELVLSDDTGVLGCWYADLIRIGSKKSVLFMHPFTRYVIVALDRKRPQIRKLDELFRSLLMEVFLAEEVEPEIIDKILSEYQNISIAKTLDKSVLGSMTDMVRHVKWNVDGLDEVTAQFEVKLSRNLNHMPVLANDAIFPCEMMGKLLAERYGFSGEFSKKAGSLSQHRWKRRQNYQKESQALGQRDYGVVYIKIFSSKF